MHLTRTITNLINSKKKNQYYPVTIVRQRIQRIYIRIFHPHVGLIDPQLGHIEISEVFDTRILHPRHGDVLFLNLRLRNVWDISQCCIFTKKPPEKDIDNEISIVCVGSFRNDTIS